jgi:hypothetical protein
VNQDLTFLVDLCLKTIDLHPANKQLWCLLGVPPLPLSRSPSLPPPSSLLSLPSPSSLVVVWFCLLF